MKAVKNDRTDKLLQRNIQIKIIGSLGIDKQGILRV